jgi:agmatinase
MAFDYAHTADVPARIEAHVAGLIGASAALLIGGDHSVTLPSLRAHAAKHGALGLCQIDAHPDTWSDDQAARVDHGTIIYKAVQEGLIDAKRSVQIGTRVEVENEVAFGITRIDARAVHAKGPQAVAEQARAVLGDGATYLTFDIDALDPAFAPGTGTPVWGGLTTDQTGVLLRGLAGINLVGADVVEVSPPFDHAQITALAAAHVAYDLIALWGWPDRD